MRIMVALGGNVLLERGEKPDAEIQRHHVRRAARALAPILADHEMIICHGNGPQVGVLALESEADASLTRPFPLDFLVAQTQGMIGYWLAQELHNAGVTHPIVALMTQTIVDGDDPAFASPTKFIGPTYDAHTAQSLADRHGRTIAPDGTSWRRVVASPQPQRIVEQDSIRLLLDAGTVVICGGGGGAPATEDGAGRPPGVEAVVDEDLTATQIALATSADRLLLLTDVPAVMRDFGTDRAAPTRWVTLADATNLPAPAGSMAPKLQACVRFTAATAQPPASGALADAADILVGIARTTISTGSGTPGNHGEQ